MKSLTSRTLIHDKTQSSVRIRTQLSKSPLKTSSNDKFRSTSNKSHLETHSIFITSHFEPHSTVQETAHEIFEAKCKDLQICPQPKQEQRFIQAFHTNYQSRKLVLQETNLGECSCLVLAKIFNNTNSFAHVNLSKNKLNEFDMIKIVQALMFNLNLVSLDISSTDLSQSTCAQIFPLLANHPSLYSLDLSSHQFLYRNKLSNSEHLTSLLKNRTLTFLNLSGTALGNEGLKHLILGLAHNSVLYSLNLNTNYIKGTVIKDFVEALATTQIGELFLANNQIEEIATEEISYFLTGLYGYGVVTKLSLANNLITGQAVYKLFDAMIKENYLLQLNLENNDLTGYLDVVERMLQNNKRMKVLNLSNCLLKTESFVQICVGLGKNTALETLILSHNFGKDTGAAAMAKALKKNTKLIRLDVADNKICNTGGCCLAQAVKTNQSLKSLNLSDNELKDEAGEAFFFIFGTNYTLTALFLQLNPMSAKYLLDIKKYLERNKVCEEKKAVKNILENKKNMKPGKFTADDIQQRVEDNLKKKKKVEKRIGAYMKKINGIKKGVDEKLEEMQETVKELKGKNVELSTNLNGLLLEIKVWAMQQYGFSEERKVEGFEERIQEIDKNLRVLCDNREVYVGKKLSESVNEKKEKFQEVCSELDRELILVRHVKGYTQRNLESLKKNLVEKKVAFGSTVRSNARTPVIKLNASEKLRRLTNSKSPLNKSSKLKSPFTKSPKSVKLIINKIPI